MPEHDLDPVTSTATGASSSTPFATALRVIFLGGVAAAAAGSGLVLLSIPGSTSRFFSWSLTPPAVAAIVGGFYVASAVVIGLALLGRPAMVRTLSAASLFLTIPTFVATLVHLDLFDFGRWQAVAWVLLFGGAPLVFVALLLVTRGRDPEIEGRHPPWARAILAVLGAGFAVAAVTLWWSPESGGRWLPVEAAGLGGRFLGSWMAFLAAMAAAALVTGRGPGSRIALAALVAFPAGAVVGAVRIYGDLEPGGRLTFVLALAAVTLVVTMVALSEMRATPANGRH